MLSIRIKRPTAVVVHPQHPELKVTIEEPSVAAYMEYQARVREYSKIETAINPATKEPIRDKDGRLETIDLPASVPVTLLADYLAEHFRAIEGLEEKSPDFKEAAAAFIEKPFACQVEKEIDEEVNGKKVKVKKPATEPFALYILGKLHSEATFTRPDPLASTSVSQPSNA